MEMDAVDEKSRCTLLGYSTETDTVFPSYVLFVSIADRNFRPTPIVLCRLPSRDFHHLIG